MDSFEKDYLQIYDSLSLGELYDWVDNGNLSKILAFDNKNHSWTEYDHSIAYETFFGCLRDDIEYNYMLKLSRDEMINDLKINVPDTWEIYLKIIDFYSQK